MKGFLSIVFYAAWWAFLSAFFLPSFINKPPSSITQDFDLSDEQREEALDEWRASEQNKFILGVATTSLVALPPTPFMTYLIFGKKKKVEGTTNQEGDKPT